MSKYRKKPVVIDAVQFDGSRRSIDAICRWANDDGIDEPTVAYNFTGSEDVLKPVVMTLEGDMAIGVGDFVIRGVKGEFYPCKPDIFYATYEPVSDTPDVP
jgi:hypothetical protein